MPVKNLIELAIRDDGLRKFKIRGNQLELLISILSPEVWTSDSEALQIDSFSSHVIVRHLDRKPSSTLLVRQSIDLRFDLECF